MRDSIIIQCGRDAEYQELLDLTEPRHQEYANQHGFRYARCYGKWAAGWPGYWDPIVLLAAALDMGYELAVRLDADAFIAGDQDFREALPENGHIGMVKHIVPREMGQRPIWNTGVMIVRNTLESRAFLLAMLDNGPGEHPWWDNMVAINLLYTGRWRYVATHLDDKWNSTIWANQVENPVVAAWHGIPLETRGTMMQAYIEAQGE